MVESEVAVERGLEISYKGEEEMIKAKEDAQELGSRFKDGSQAALFCVQHFCLQHWL